MECVFLQGGFHGPQELQLPRKMSVVWLQLSENIIEPREYDHPYILCVVLQDEATQKLYI